MGFSLREKANRRIDVDKCTGCGQCVEICPGEALELRDGKAHAVSGNFLGCIACGHCTAVCPHEAIHVLGRAMLLDDNAPLPAAVPASAEGLAALMATRRSTRQFKPDAVPRETLERIVEMAASAPMGIPPHEVGVIVLPTAEKVQAYAADACASFARMARFLNPFMTMLMRPMIGRARYEAFNEFIRPLLKHLAAGRKAGRDDFTYNAPAAMIFHYGPMADDGDGAIVVTYAMLAAESLGLGSCMLGTSSALTHDRQFKQKYDIPQENKVGLTLILGHPATTFNRTIRRRLASVRYA